MTMLKKFSSYNNVIILNGDLSDNKLLEKLSRKNIIAVDGAGSRLIDLGIMPNYIIGDLDSATPLAVSGCQIVQIIDDDTTDFQKTLLFAQEHNMLPAIIIGMSGGELDHIYGNLNYFVKHNTAGSLIVDSYDGGYKLSTIIYEELEFNADIGSKISIFPLPKSNISTSGLKWELDNKELDLFEFISLRNQAKESRIKIRVHTGKILVVVDYISLSTT